MSNAPMDPQANPGAISGSSPDAGSQLPADFWDDDDQRSQDLDALVSDNNLGQFNETVEGEDGSKEDTPDDGDLHDEADPSKEGDSSIHGDIDSKDGDSEVGSDYEDKKKPEPMVMPGAAPPRRTEK